MVSRTAQGSDQRRGLFAITAAGNRLFATVAPDSERLYESISAEFGKRKLATRYSLLAEFATAVTGAVAIGEADPQSTAGAVATVRGPLGHLRPVSCAAAG